MLECERKFLVVGEYKMFAHNSIHLIQGYIASGRRTVRVRISDNEAWLTIKGPSHDGGLTRYEWEKSIDAKEALELMQLAEGALIEKRRYLVEYEGHTFEVDEFAGDNEGLVVAEVELQESTEKVALPEWIGREVTGIKRYYNSHLREHPYKVWSEAERLE
ncbi:MAG: CYTH domain-containing protein [Alistipes sp.]|jgi:CYTH domain-containing protein|nr:CYTH domain-containing protein [Alistipes sp.]